MHVLVMVLVEMMGMNVVAVNLMVGPKTFVVVTGAGVMVLVGVLVFAGNVVLLVIVFVVVVLLMLVVVESGVLVTVTFDDISDGSILSFCLDSPKQWAYMLSWQVSQQPDQSHACTRLVLHRHCWRELERTRVQRTSDSSTTGMSIVLPHRRVVGLCHCRGAHRCLGRPGCS